MNRDEAVLDMYLCIAAPDKGPTEFLTERMPRLRDAFRNGISNGRLNRRQIGLNLEGHLRERSP